jgi:hypothetical protein
MPKTPTAELREAASLLREAASHATDGPWRPHDTHLDHGGHTATVMTDRPDLNASYLIAWVPTMSHEPWDETRNAWRNAGWMALMHPGVGLALADWLDAHAQILTTAAQADPDSSLARHAVAVARQILGAEVKPR